MLHYCEELESVDVGGCTCLRSLVISECHRLGESSIRGWDRLGSDPSVEICVNDSRK
ncbi:hypothetical protein KP509_1Z265200 [Ceratopteris richardii]|nr:hypothetical protein KP509_1Z265200 [Ceratopteris richardii]